MPDIDQDYATERRYRAFALWSLVAFVREPPLVTGNQ
jgi:hypothetical protein